MGYHNPLIPGSIIPYNNQSELVSLMAQITLFPTKRKEVFSGQMKRTKSPIQAAG
jgi:hypothetical protein